MRTINETAFFILIVTESVERLKSYRNGFDVRLLGKI